MNDDARTKEQLIRELEALRQRVTELEQGLPFPQAPSIRADSADSRFKELFRAVMEKISEGLHLVRLDDLLLIYTNPKLEQMLGYQPGELISKPVTIINAPGAKTPEETKELIFSALKKTGSWSGEVWNARRDGTIILCHATVSMLDHPDFGTVIVSIHTDITGQRQANEALRENQELFSLFMKHSPIYTFIKEVTPTQSRVLQASENYQEMLGIPGSAMLGKTMEELFPPEFAAKISADDWNVVSKGEVLKLFEELGNRSYDTIKFPIPRKDKTLLAGYTIDVTERVRALKALSESEAKLRAVIDAAPFPMVIVDRNDNNILFWSHSAQLLFGHSAPTASQWYEIAYPDPQYRQEVIARWKPFLELARTSGQPVNTGEYRVTCRDGSVRVCELFAAFVAENLVVTFNDITGKKAASEALAAEKERLAVTLRCIADGVIATDVHSNIVLMNKVAETLTGCNFEEACGKPLTAVCRILHEKTREPLENPVEKILSSGQICELPNHTLLVSRDGTNRVITNSGAPIKDSNSVTIGVVLVFRDITEEQKLIDTAQRSTKLESLGVLAGGIAHDFNNLMGGIYGFIDLARDESRDQGVSDFLGKAMNTIERARGLTQQLLTFAKGGAPIKVNDHLFPTVQETAQFALSGSNVSCHFDIQKNLSPCNFDKNQIGQVIENLIINAQQAMPLGGTIELVARNVTLGKNDQTQLAEGRYVRISIKDSGTGIPKEFHSRIFDPFFSTKTKGHGLGLAVCYSIMHRHGGAIEVESESGKGSTFHLFFPAVTDLSPRMAAAPDIPHRGLGTIIVMDDEDVMRETIGSMLEMLGYSVFYTRNGSEAVEFFMTQARAGQPVAGLILDLTVPGAMGGKAAVEEIRKLSSGIPVFVASGYADDPVMRRPTEFGFTASICKPFKKSELSDMLNRHMPGTK